MPSLPPRYTQNRARELNSLFTLYYGDTLDPEEEKCIQSLTHDELSYISSKATRTTTLATYLASKGFGKYIAHLLTEEDIIAVDSASHTRLIHLLADHPFPTSKFPHHLLTDELINEVPDDGFPLIACLARATQFHAKDAPLDNFPIYHLDPKWLSPKQILFCKYEGRNSTLSYLLDAGPPGHTVIKQSGALRHAAPEALLSDRPIVGGNLLTDILANDACHLVPPDHFKDHTAQAFAVAKTCLRQMQDVRSNDDPTGPVLPVSTPEARQRLGIWIAQIAQIAMCKKGRTYA